jgi:glycosyltransferase involved in cell wall biosynthesis
METVDVVIPWFGSAKEWGSLSERAGLSVENQTVWGPGLGYFSGKCDETSLGAARNHFAYQSTADWLIFLDADDELDPKYVESMLAGDGDVRWPSTLGVVDGVEDDYPVLLQPRPNLIISNHCIIGSMVRWELFEKVGGFRDFPVLEDWDFWIRCALAGADFQPCPSAIYRVHVRADSRNTDLHLHGQVYQQIQAEHEAAWYQKFGVET